MEDRAVMQVDQAVLILSGSCFNEELDFIVDVSCLVRSYNLFIMHFVYLAIF